MYSCFIFLVEVILVAFLCLPWSLWLLFTFCFPSFGNEPFLPRAHLFALNTELNSITEGWLDQLWTPLKREQKFCSRLFYETTSPPFLLPSSAQTVLPPYSTSPITLKSNLNEVESWNVGEIATKCRIKQLPNTRVYVLNIIKMSFETSLFCTKFYHFFFRLYT